MSVERELVPVVRLEVLAKGYRNAKGVALQGSRCPGAERGGSAPQIARRQEPFRSPIRKHLKGGTEALADLAIELLAHGRRVRAAEDAFRDKSGQLLISRAAVSELGERLWADDQESAPSEPFEYDRAYRFTAS